MTVKQFFKSETFKCLAVLLCIALIAGGLLAILNDVLYISPEERTARAIKSIYGQSIEYNTIRTSEDEAISNDYGYINDVYLLDDGCYLIKSTGNNGYKGGTVTCWVVAKFESNTFTGINKVTVESYEKQTLMSSIKSSFYDVFASNDNLITSSDDVYFTTSNSNSDLYNITSGATYSSRAIVNAVNSALNYIRTDLTKEA